MQQPQEQKQKKEEHRRFVSQDSVMDSDIDCTLWQREWILKKKIIYLRSSTRVRSSDAALVIINKELGVRRLNYNSVTCVRTITWRTKYKKEYKIDKGIPNECFS